MATAIRNSGIILEKEDEEYVWRFSAILKPMFHATDERGFGVSYDLKSPPATIDVMPFSCGGDLAPTTHQGFQAVQHQPATASPPSSAPKEINPAPLIFAGMMLLMTAFHGWGMWQYYQGSIDNRMECKQ